MIAVQNLTAIVSDPATTLEDLKPDHLACLLALLTSAEHPESFKVLFALLLQTLQDRPDLHTAITEAWSPSEEKLARLLEDAGSQGTRVVLSLKGVRGEMERVWQLCDELGLQHLIATSDPLEALALAPMAALETERQLDELLASVARDRQWSDPAEILNPEGEPEFDLEALIALAQARLAKTEGEEALSIVLLRLMSLADQVH